MVIASNIPIVIKILRRNRHEFATPSLTQIAEREKDPFKVLVSCILSLRTRDATTDKASERLFRVADTSEKLARVPEKTIAKLIYPVSFYKTKAGRIKKICQEINEQYNGQVPKKFDELMKFKGVGRKTANIVLVYGFSKKAIPVDTHVHRVSNRLGWVSTKTPEETEFALVSIVEKKYWMDLNDLLVQFGQNICIPTYPRCNLCPVSKYCRYYKEVYEKNKEKEKNKRKRF